MNSSSKLLLKRIITLAIFLVPFLPVVAAQYVEPFHISGLVVDKSTNQPALGAVVELCDSAGNVLQSEVAGESTLKYLKERRESARKGENITRGGVGGNLVKVEATFKFEIPRADRKYILKVSNGEKYDTTYVDLPIKDVGRREPPRKVPTIYVERKPLNLEEVTVATKVKFFYKGDTLIYNADAFNLPVGSMLDDLVKAIGCELKSDGTIIHQGRRVEELLLNGKAFFDNRKLVMLENLGSYTVDKLKFYDKTGERSRLAKRILDDDKQYALDVRLKKEYSFGTIVNAGAGLGTNDRYMGRLFALTFTNVARFAFVGSLGNVDDVKPGESDVFRMRESSGLTRKKMGGFDYMVEPDNKKFKINGSVEVNHYDSRYDGGGKSTSFLPGGDVYSQSESSSKRKTLNVQMSHKMSLSVDNLSLSFSPSFSYSRGRSVSLGSNATLNREIEGLTMGAINDLLAGNPDSLREILVNRNVNDYASSNRALSAGGNVELMIVVPKTPDVISINAGAGYRSLTSDSHNLYDITYGNGQSPTRRNQHTRNKPNDALSFSSRIGYQPSFDYGNLNWNAAYNFSGSRYRNATEVYLLKKKAESNMTYGVYEADDDLISVLDGQNSKSTTSESHTHTLSAYMEYRIRNVSIGFDNRFSLNHNRLDYRHELLDTILSRDMFRYDPNLNINYRSNRSTLYSLDYSYSKSSYPLSSRININDTSDPMNVYESNDNLRDPSRHNISLGISTRCGRAWHRFDVRSIISLDKIVNGYSYDKSTGVRYHKPFNMSGNWSLAPGYDLSLDFGGRIPFSLNNNTSLEYARDADMLGIEGGGNEMQKVAVENYYVRERFSLRTDFSNTSLTFKAGGTWRKTFRNRSDLDDVSILDLNCGVTCSTQIPLVKMFVSTDMTFYSKSGYNLSGLKRNRLMWNARIGKGFLNDKLVIMLDGFDILHQLESVEYSVSAQGRSERYVNVIPRYVMLHAQFRFNHQPRRLNTINPNL